MAILENAVAGWITIFSLLLTVLALLAYRRSANVKVLGIAVAFALFFVKGIVVTVALFSSTRLDSVWVVAAGFDTVALLAFYLSVLKS